MASYKAKVLPRVLQHVNSNYDIDLFRTLIEAVAKVTGATDLGNKSLRVYRRPHPFLRIHGLPMACCRRMKAVAMCCVALFVARFVTAAC